MTEKKPQGQSNVERLIEIINPMIASLGYEVAHLEIQTHRGNTLRIFIDRLVADPENGIGVEDCVAVTKAIDEPLDALAEVDALFHGSYELEVSSPGVDRPLRQVKDYERFSGREARIHVFRPLTADELGNPAYQQKNPKQKHFVGVLKGVRNGNVLLALSQNASGTDKKVKKKKTGAERNQEGSRVPEVMIPLTLISKANLEPKFDFDSRDDSADV